MSESGPSTDRRNDPVVDPSQNVKDLGEKIDKSVAAGIQRQDDLRHAEAVSIRDQIKALGDLVGARFSTVDAKLATIDRELGLVENRRVEQKIDTKVAVDAALSAAEKAVKEQTLASEKAILKSETSAAEQSKQQNATFTAALKGVTDLLADVKDRVVKVESHKEGTGESARIGYALVVILLTVAIIISPHIK
jgi:hypothetical protein